MHGDSSLWQLDAFLSQDELLFIHPRLSKYAAGHRQCPTGLKTGWSRPRPGYRTYRILQGQSILKDTEGTERHWLFFVKWCQNLGCIPAWVVPKDVELAGRSQCLLWPFELVMIISFNLQSLWCLPFSKWNSGALLSPISSFGSGCSVTQSWKGEFGQSQLGHFEHIC